MYSTSHWEIRGRIAYQLLYIVLNVCQSERWTKVEKQRIHVCFSQEEGQVLGEGGWDWVVRRVCYVERSKRLLGLRVLLKDQSEERHFF